MEKTDILSMTPEELQAALSEAGEKKYRAGQLFSWLHQKNASSFSEMSNLPKELRESLSGRFALPSPEILDVKISSADNTRKYLFVLANNTIIESVLMDYDCGLAACVSSQAGCKMGCVFCASGKNGFHRDLTAGEMLTQIYSIERDLGARISRVVVMGIGEPLDNFDNTVRFIELLNSQKAHCMGMRSITVSTCGIVPRIYELAEICPQLNLAVSLHAPNGKIREGIMPIEKKYPFDTLLKACADYAQKTGRRVTFEYALIGGVNDGKRHADELARKLKGMLCHVNLIPVNEAEGINVAPSGKIGEFFSVLKKSGINATVRRRLGADIGGACGQLRSGYVNSKGVAK